jgi:hypothetical protein
MHCDGVYAEIQLFLNQHRDCPNRVVSYSVYVPSRAAACLLILRCTCGGRGEVHPSRREAALLIQTAPLNGIAIARNELRAPREPSRTGAQQMYCAAHLYYAARFVRALTELFHAGGMERIRPTR